MLAQELTYAMVNDAINCLFFDGRFATQPVYLSLDNSLRDELGTRLKIDPSMVQAAVCKSVRNSLTGTANVYAKHSFEARLWLRNGMQSPPPFSALLYTLAYAAELMAEEGSFASSNYYFRLSQITGLDRDTLQRDKQFTEPLWIGLNQWLTKHSFIFGRPTARSNVSTLRYVGWPLSQTIVRASDRDRFHDLFVRFALSGSEAISRVEMEHYLATWMLQGGANPRLKNAWSKPELRARIAEAAIAELASWSSGPTAGIVTGAQSRAIKLSLIANLVPRFPSQVLELHVGRLGEQVDQISLINSVGQFQFANDTFGSYATISPSPFRSDNSALGQSFEFEQIGSANSLFWHPRLVIPLTRPTQGSLWVEATRITFGTPHMLLVRDNMNLPARVESHLMKSAARPPNLATPSSLRGLPEGWLLYHDVQIARADVITDDKDLECLVPLGESSVISLKGGLELVPSFFHLERPPSVHLVVPSGSASLSIGALGSDNVIARSEFGGAEAELPLAEGGAVNPELQARAYQNGKFVDELAFYLRDASNPLPMSRDGRGLLSYTSVHTATQSNGAANEIFGYSAATCDQNEFAEHGGHGTALLALPDGSKEVALTASYPIVSNQQSGMQSCIEAGYHHWMLPMVNPLTPKGTPITAKCKSCGQSLIILYRTHKKPTGVAKPNASPVRIPLSALPTISSENGSLFDFDLLLDALSFIGSGSWGKFETLLSSISPMSGYPRQIAQDCMALGILELEQRKGSGAYRAWCVPAPAINFILEDRSFLSGFRSERLVEELQIRVTQAGGKLFRQKRNAGPSAIFIEGLSPTKVRNAIDGLLDPHQRQVTVNEQPALNLAAACIAMPSLKECLAPASIGRAANLQMFNVRTARWEDVTTLQGSGGYRWNEGYQAYGFVDRDGNAFAGPHQVVKLLAARDAAIRLHTYDITNQTFYSTLGCEPVGLLARALVACSGMLPTIDSGKTKYQCVPPQIATRVLTILYEEDRK